MKRIDAALLGAVVLLAVYLLTLAPDVTFWDAGEFLAAASVFGIPHPPGTPLYIGLLNVWTKIWFFLPFAAAANLFSAVVTALAAAVSARLVQRATSSAAMAFAAAVAAGGMSTVWQSATETEVYAAALALGVVTVASGERAGREPGVRWLVLTAYLIALAVSVHLSALVAAPAAIVLATWTPKGIQWSRAGALTGVFLMTMGAGRMSLGLIVLGGLTAAIPALILDVMGGSTPRPRSWRGRTTVLRAPAGTRYRFPAALGMTGVAVLALTPLAILYFRAAFDPAINQGNPSTWQALVDVVSRRQYAVASVWPRMAPVWIQLANLGQWADWQVALSAGPTVMPSIPRTLATIGFLALGFQGAMVHRRADRRTFWGLLTLFAAGTLGVLVYLNLRAGPSLGYGVLPNDVVREARERDYFFVFGFWAWGLWSGVGAVALALRWRRPVWAGALIALLPVVLNWRAVTRRAEPEASLPRLAGQAILESVPRDGVLLAMGDNDSYPLWYLQQVHGLRRDVTVVTVPLLPTPWYRAEMMRRHGLLDESDIMEPARIFATAARILANARTQGRAIAASPTMTAAERLFLGSAWQAQGLVYVAGDTGIDTTAAKRRAEWIAPRLSPRPLRPAIDPVHAYFHRMLNCPRQLLDAARVRDASALDSVCNYR